MPEPTRAAIRSALSKSTLFVSLLPDEMDRLVSICVPRKLPAGAVLFREGDPGDAMFVVVAGRVEVHINGPDGDVVLNTFDAGDIFGEIAVLDGRGRTASATGVVASDLLAIGRPEFHAFLDAFPRYTNVLLHLIVERMRTAVQLFPRLDGLSVDFDAVGNSLVAESDSRAQASPGSVSKVVGERNGRTSSLPAQATEIPEVGTSAAAIYRRIHDEVQLEGQPHLNVASFVTTWMESEAEQLAHESINKNLINATEYAQTEAIHQQVVAMTASLFHATLPASEPEPGEASGLIGTTTVGSSEAIMLALLAHKWNWKRKHDQRPDRSTKDRPYLVIGTHTHACFAKFARYFDVEVKWVHLRPGVYAITAEQVRTILEMKIVDDPEVMERCGFGAQEAGDRCVGELVMAVGCVVGTTYTGAIDDVEGIDRLLREGGWDIPVHVDAATGGFILPFTEAEGDREAEGNRPLKWDFRLARVMSINVSNHKYGLVYPGLGTLVFRDATIVPAELLIDIHYLSGEMQNFSLNFSRASSGVILQYYNFLRLGKAGYRRVIQGCLTEAQYLAHAIETSPALGRYFEVVSKTEHLPIVAVRFNDRWLDSPPFALQALANQLEALGWMAPVYHLPPDNDEVEVMRIVVRAHFNHALARAFLHDLEAALEEVSRQPIAAERSIGPAARAPRLVNGKLPSANKEQR